MHTWDNPIELETLWQGIFASLLFFGSILGPLFEFSTRLKNMPLGFGCLLLRCFASRTESKYFAICMLILQWKFLSNIIYVNNTNKDGVPSIFYFKVSYGLCFTHFINCCPWKPMLQKTPPLFTQVRPFIIGIVIYECLVGVPLVQERPSPHFIF